MMKKIVVDIGATNVSAGIEQNGVISRSDSTILKEKNNLGATLRQLTNFLAPYVPGSQCIGIGVPSVVDVANGIVYDTVNIPSWKEVHLKTFLESEFGLPVYINNDVNCFVLGEYHFGNARDSQSVVGISIGTGVGVGLIIDGKLYCGANCGAGELGQIPYLDHNLEHYVSGSFFPWRFGVSALDAWMKMESSPEEGQLMWDEYGEHMAYAVMMTVYAYDPEIVVFGGSLAKGYPFFKRRMYAVILEKFAFPKSMDKLKIFASDDENIPLLGASLLPLEGAKILI